MVSLTRAILLLALVLLPPCALAAADPPSPCVCTAALPPPPSLPSSPATSRSPPNLALGLLSAALQVLPGLPGLPHRLAILCTVMYDALGFSKGPPSPRVTTATPPRPPSLPSDIFSAAAGAAALRKLAGPTRASAVSAALVAFAPMLPPPAEQDAAGLAFLMAAMAKFPLSDPEAPGVAYVAPNAPPASPGIPQPADCAALRRPSLWQPECMAAAAKRPGCAKAQMPPFVPLRNASLLSAAGARDVAQLVAGLPSPPPMMTDSLEEELKRTDASRFARDYLEVVRRAAQLDDTAKVSAEQFGAPAIITMARVVLTEFEARPWLAANVAETTRAMFVTFGAMRDALVATASLKLRHSTARPASVLPCGLGRKTVRGWAGPYEGVREILAADWRPFLKTPPFPGFPSGHTAVAVAGAEALALVLVRGPALGGNCLHVSKGMSVTEPAVLDSKDEMFRSGRTDVANVGKGSVGFVPNQNVTLCWRSVRELADKIGESRVVGGIHTQLDIDVGETVGLRAAWRMKDFDIALRAAASAGTS